MENKLNKKQPFIITTDVNTSETLKKLNFTLISEENGKYMFLNDSTLKFDNDKNEIKLDKMCYTNVMCMNN